MFVCLSALYFVNLGAVITPE
jgi:transposase